MGPPGREGLVGARGEPVSHFQSMAGLSNRRQMQHRVKLTDRYGHTVALKLFLLLSLLINFLIQCFVLYPRANKVNLAHQEKQVSLDHK